MHALATNIKEDDINMVLMDRVNEQTRKVYGVICVYASSPCTGGGVVKKTAVAVSIRPAYNMVRTTFSNERSGI